MIVTRLLAALSLAFVPLAAAQSEAPVRAPLVVTAEQDFIVPVEVNGRLLRLRLDPGTERIVLNPEAAAAAGLDGSMFGVAAMVGPVRVNGRTSLTRVAIGDWRERRRVMWFSRPVVSGADGVIGMAMLPHPVSALRFREATADDRTITIPVAEDGQFGLLYRHPVGGETIQVSFRLWQPLTQATASAGAHLAAHHGGTWSGEAMERPVLLGVERPVRPMQFAAPLSFGGLRLDGLLVRTADFRGAFVLPSDPSADPDEIVVTGNVRRGRARLTVTIGNDVAGRCASVTYDRAAGTLTMVCPSAMSG